jgi:murein DD-endopeptidase MepM/ murein hydrolase activator NlpD
MIPVEKAKVPTAGKLSFGYQRSPTHRHQGVDLVAPLGTPVRAAAPGRVVNVVNAYTPGFRGYGKTVVVWNAPMGLYFLYAHLDSITVSPGQTVMAGDQLGTVGKTAYTEAEPTGDIKTGPHLHFEVSRGAYPKPSEAPRVDPVAVLRDLAGGAVPALGNGGAVLLVLLGLALLFLSSR